MAITMTMATSCSQEPIDTSISVKEEYTRNFIKEFGIPDPGHDYAMATSAGLRVKSATGGHVTVTAEVDGKEYLFADLDVPAGTHALPVTLPKSVSRLKIKNGLAEQMVGIDELVDIDRLGATNSRGWDIRDTNSGIKVNLDFSNDGEGQPILVFRPDEFLTDYLKEHPEGKDNTNTWYTGKDEGNGAIDMDQDPSIPVFFGETAFGSAGDYLPAENKFQDLEYLIFPLWWRTDRYGNKDYRLSVYQFDAANHGFVADFSQENNQEQPIDKPFPQIGFSTTKIDVTNESGINASFTYDDGTFINAYDPYTTGTVVTKGMRIKFTSDDWDQSAIRMDLRSGGNKGDSKYSYSSTVPYYNRLVWGENYFDVAIKDLLFATVSTMQYEFEGQYFNILNYSGNIDKDKGLYCSRPLIVGFNSAPAIPGDRTPRDYSDVLLLVLPIKGLELFYDFDYIPEAYPWTIAAEDLGATDDWDFNDVVFTFTDVITNLNAENRNNVITNKSGPLNSERVRIITVEPKATGGTMPIYITFTGTVGKAAHYMTDWSDEWFSEVNKKMKEANDNMEKGTFVLGTEVHRWLGASHYTNFVNVGDKRQATNARKVSFAIDVDSKLSAGMGTGGAFGSGENLPLYGFSLLVDKENKLGIDAFDTTDYGFVKLDGYKPGEGTFLIGRPSENGSIAPQMLMLKADWEWPTERTKISDAYPDFSNWIQNADDDTWITNPTEGKVTKK